MVKEHTHKVYEMYKQSIFSSGNLYVNTISIFMTKKNLKFQSVESWRWLCSGEFLEHQQSIVYLGQPGAHTVRGLLTRSPTV